jgi:tetratricopeptide (TPR) repeat protein
VWHLDRLIAAEPDVADHFALRADAHASLGHWEYVVADCTRAIEGKNDRLWAVRGNAHAELGHWKEAAADYQRALGPPSNAAGPSLALSQGALAVLRLHQGNEAGYREICEKALASAVANTGPRRGFSPMNITLLTLGPGAVKDFGQLLELHKNREETGYFSDPGELGSILYRMGRYEEALKALSGLLGPSESVRTAPDWFFLAMAQHRSKNAEQQALARTSLARGIEQMEAQERAQADQDVNLFRVRSPLAGGGWQQRLMNQILRREAKAELEKP